jgi:hypothetical protein
MNMQNEGYKRDLGVFVGIGVASTLQNYTMSVDFIYIYITWNDIESYYTTSDYTGITWVKFKSL